VTPGNGMRCDAQVVVKTPRHQGQDVPPRTAVRRIRVHPEAKAQRAGQRPPDQLFKLGLQGVLGNHQAHLHTVVGPSDVSGCTRGKDVRLTRSRLQDVGRPRLRPRSSGKRSVDVDVPSFLSDELHGLAVGQSPHGGAANPRHGQIHGEGVDTLGERQPVRQVDLSRDGFGLTRVRRPDECHPCAHSVQPTRDQARSYISSSSSPPPSATSSVQGPLPAVLRHAPYQRRAYMRGCRGGRRPRARSWV
jgi:hypothetical protein